MVDTDENKCSNEARSKLPQVICQICIYSEMLALT